MVCRFRKQVNKLEVYKGVYTPTASAISDEEPDDFFIGSVSIREAKEHELWGVKLKMNDKIINSKLDQVRH